MTRRKRARLDRASSPRTSWEDEVLSNPSTGFDKHHPLLRSLPEGEPRERYNTFKNGKFNRNWYLNWDFLQEIGVADELREKLKACGLDKVFNIIEPVYGELTLEFYCTFERKKIAASRRVESMVKFRLGGQWHNLTYDEFSEACGFSESNYRRGHVEAGYPKELKKRDFWREIIHENGDTNYNPSRSRNTNLRDPVLRIFHRILSHTLTGRHKSDGGVCQAGDMVYMYCFEKGIRTHPGCLFAAYLEKKIGMLSSAYISAGSFITRLARNLGVLEQHLPTLTKISDMVPLGKKTLHKMGVIKRSREGYEVLRGGESESESESESDSDSDDLWMVNPNESARESEEHTQPQKDLALDQRGYNPEPTQPQEQHACPSIEDRLDTLSQRLKQQQQQIIANQDLMRQQIDWIATAFIDVCSQLQVTPSTPRPTFDSPIYHTDRL